MLVLGMRNLGICKKHISIYIRNLGMYIFEVWGLGTMVPHILWGIELSWPGA
jgi:hypothetical protein